MQGNIFYCQIEQLQYPISPQLNLQIIWTRKPSQSKTSIFSVTHLPKQPLFLKTNIQPHKNTAFSTLSLVIKNTQQHQSLLGYANVNLATFKKEKQQMKINLKKSMDQKRFIKINYWCQKDRGESGSPIYKRYLDHKQSKQQNSLYSINNELEKKILTLQQQIYKNRIKIKQMENVILKCQHILGMQRELDQPGLISCISVISRQDLVDRNSSQLIHRQKIQQKDKLINQLNTIIKQKTQSHLDLIQQNINLKQNLQECNRVKFTHINQTLQFKKQINQLITLYQKQKTFSQQQYSINGQLKSQSLKLKLIVRQLQTQQLKCQNKIQLSIHNNIIKQSINQSQRCRQYEQEKQLIINMPNIGRNSWPQAILINNKIFRLNSLQKLKTDISQLFNIEFKQQNNNVYKNMICQSQNRYKSLLNRIQEQRNKETQQLRSLLLSCQSLTKQKSLLSIQLQQLKTQNQHVQQQLTKLKSSTLSAQQLVRLKKVRQQLKQSKLRIQQLNIQNQQLIKSLVKYKVIIQRAQKQIIQLRQQCFRLRKNIVIQT